MLKGLLFIILLVIVIGAVILMIAVNFVMSIFRRIRRGGYDDDYDNNDYVRRHSNQYNFRGTTTSYSRNTSAGQQSQTEENVNNTSNTNSCSSKASGQEIIVDTRDANVAKRQIIADDEGEYVDFGEED